MAATEASARAARVLDDLYREHVGDVYRYTYAVLGNHADAEDVTQTAFVNALHALERGERPRKPGNWLIVIAHNIVRQRWRQEHARPTEVELVAEVADRPGDDTGPALTDVVRALQKIPSSQREALVMRELEGRPYREIAEILGITMGALETLLFRARRSLAEEMDNLVTCDSAELAISRRLDGRLGRKDRRRLDEHLRECAACAAFAAGQQRRQKAVRGLAVLPLPASLLLWKGAPAASAAAALPAVGVGAGAAVGTGAVGSGAAVGGGAAAGGLALGGLTAKAAAVVAAVGVVGGVGYEGAKLVADEPATPPRASTTAVSRASDASRVSPNRVVPGRATATAARAKQAEAAKNVPGTQQAAQAKRAAAPAATKASAARNRASRKGPPGARAPGKGASIRKSVENEPRAAKGPGAPKPPASSSRSAAPSATTPASGTSATSAGEATASKRKAPRVAAKAGKAQGPRAKKNRVSD